MGGAKHYKVDIPLLTVKDGIDKAYKILDNCATGYDIIMIRIVSKNPSLVIKIAEEFHVKEACLEVDSSKKGTIHKILKKNGVNLNQYDFFDNTVYLTWVDIKTVKDILALPVKIVEIEIRPYVEKDDLNSFIELFSEDTEAQTLIEWGEGNINWMESGVPGYNYLSLFINHTLEKYEPGIRELIFSINYKLFDIDEIVDTVMEYTEMRFIYLYDE